MDRQIKDGFALWVWAAAGFLRRVERWRRSKLLAVEGSARADKDQSMGKRRRRGTGTIEKQRDGRWRPRLPGAGKRLDPCETPEEAWRLLDAALEVLANDAGPDQKSATLQSFGPKWLDQRELSGVRSIATDRSRWRCWVATATFYTWQLSMIRPRDVRAWARLIHSSTARAGRGHSEAPDRTLGRQTAQNSLNLLRCALEAAVEEELIPTNPARGVRLPKASGRTHESWTYLLPAEQTRLLTTETIPLESRNRLRALLNFGA